MPEILTCILCGRRGTHDFEVVTDSTNPAAGQQVRCRYRPGCQRRIDTRAAEQNQATADAQAEEFASARALAGLAHELDQLRQAIRIAEVVPAQVEELARVVHQLAETVRAKPGRREPVSAPSWLDLPTDMPEVGVPAPHAVLRDLVPWLRDVYLRYADAVKSFPDCWLWHPDVVEELLWLMWAWHAAYRDENATVALAGDWHDRYRPGVVRRIKQAAGTCSLENHTPRDGTPTGSCPVVPLAETLGPLADWWATGREQAPPTPTDGQLRAAAMRPVRGGGRR